MKGILVGSFAMSSLELSKDSIPDKTALSPGTTFKQASLRQPISWSKSKFTGSGQIVEAVVIESANAGSQYKWLLNLSIKTVLFKLPSGLAWKNAIH